MRILLVTRGLPFHARGGMEAVSWDLARAFSDMGCEVRVLTTRTPLLPSISTVDGVEIECIDAPTARYSRAWWRKSREAYFNSYRDWADVVLSVSAGAFSIAKDRNRGHAKFFVQAHGTSWGEAVSKIRLPGIWPKLTALKNIYSMGPDLQYRYFDGMIAVGEKVKADLETFPSKWITGNLPVFCVPNGVDTAAFKFDAVERAKMRSALGISADARVGLIASRLHAQKGIANALNGFSLLKKRREEAPDALIIAGDGPERARIEGQLLQDGLQGSVKVIGHVDRENLHGVMSAADYLLFTTLRVEGLPMNVLEARANGLSVILSEAVNHPDFEALAVDPMSAESIADAIDSLNLKTDRASELHSSYTLRACAEAYVQIFSR